MAVLWRRGPSRGAEVHQALLRRRTSRLAYTTVLNVLANLEGKGVVVHHVEGRAYRFSATLSKDELAARQARRRARALFDDLGDAAVSAIIGEVRGDPKIAELFRRLIDDGDAAGGT